VAVTTKTKVVIEAEDKTRQAFNSVQSNLNSLKSIVGGISTFGLGSALSVGGIVAFTKSAIDSLDTLKDLSKATGVAVDDLAGFNLAAQQSGTDLEKVAQAIGFVSKTIPANAKYFKELGISAKDPVEAFKQLADVFVSMKDPQDRALFASKAFGKSWQEIAPLLSEGSASIGEMVEKGKELSGVTQEMVDEADKFNDQLKELEIGAKSTGFGFAKILLPSLNDTAKEMREFVAAGHPAIALLRGWQGLGKIPFDLLFPAEDLKKATSASGILKQLKEDLADLQSKPKGRYGAGSDTAQIEQLKTQIALYEKFQKVLDKPKGKPTAKVEDPFAALNKFLKDSDYDTAAGKRKKELADLKTAFEEATNGIEKTAPQYLAALQRYKEKEKEIIAAGIKAPKKDGNENIAKSMSENTATLIKTFQDGLLPAQSMSEKLQDQLDTYTALDPQVKSYLQTLLDQATAQDDLATAIERTNDEMQSVLDFDTNAQQIYNEVSETYNSILQETEDVNISLIENDKKRARAQLELEHQRRLERLAGMEGEADDIALLIEAENDRYSAAQEKMLQDTKKTASIGKELGLTFTSAFEDSIVKGEKFSDVLEGIEQDFTRIMARRLVTEPLTNAADELLSGIDLGSIFSSIFGSANGNAFGQHGLIPYADGGVVTRATPFMFGNGGRFGVMGEAGPEAILPLRRGANGRLGVESGGMGGGNVVVNIIGAPNQPEVRQRNDGNGGMTVDVIFDAMKANLAKDIRSEGPFAQALQGQYGLNRAAGAR